MCNGQNSPLKPITRVSATRERVTRFFLYRNSASDELFRQAILNRDVFMRQRRYFYMKKPV